MEKVTAIIPTYNEEAHIEAAIESVSWADEIIIVDSFSNDKTVELAKKFNVKILEHEYINSASQKNWVIPKASHPWIFLLDADERCTPELKDEILTIIKMGTPFVAFWIYRINHFMGEKIRFSGWQSDKVIRLFKRDDCRYQNLNVHAEIETKGEISVLKNKLIHYTYKDLMTYLKKADRYTTWGAQDRFEKFKKNNKTIGPGYIFFRPIGRFLRHYFLRLGFLDGAHGLVVSMLASYNVFIRALKIWRLQKGEKL
jgi:glycosyltransferase involved in cell wall biosynthesis